MKTIVCMKWGDKYDGYESKLYDTVKDQCDKFICVTDKPINDYDIILPNDYEGHDCFTVEKLLLFNEDKIGLEGDEFLFFDLDVLIHNPVDKLWHLPMDKPYLIEGYWQNPDNFRKNFGKNGQGTKYHSSRMRGNRGQCRPVYDQFTNNIEYLSFVYFSLDNYLIHKWYSKDFFNTFPKGVAYSWYKGNTFPDDIETKVFRDDHIICMFNNSEYDDGIDNTELEQMTDIEELKERWKI